MKLIKNKKLFCTMIVIIGLSLVLLISTFLLNKELNQYSESSKLHKEIEDFVVKEKVENVNVSSENTTVNNNSSMAASVYSIDFDKLKEKAPDTVGWIIQENTIINYPVMQTDNNDYYLNHLYNGVKNKTGSIYIDYENNPEFKDYNTIIYGHNLNDGAMFASLLNYKNQDYYNTNKKFNLILPDANYEIEIFSAFTANPDEIGTSKSPWSIKWENYENYSKWLENMQKRSIIKSDTMVTSDDRIVTFSTCTADGRNRFIVMGKLVYLNEN